MALSTETLMDMYRRMRTIRTFEEKLTELWQTAVQAQTSGKGHYVNRPERKPR